MVWDWNGTLLDDVTCCVQVANQMLGEFELPQFCDVADYRATFRFPIIDYYARLGFDTSSGGNFEAAAHRFIELYGPASTTCGLHDGAVAAMTALRHAGIRQVVISASQRDNLMAQLAPFGLGDLLDAVHGIDDIYAASKQDLARRWLEDEGISPDRVLFVGDTQHDFEITEALGARCVLFSGGHHAHAHLQTLGPRVIDDLREVPELVARG